MMAPSYFERKVERKQRRCEAIIKFEYEIEPCETPTNILCILNAGLCTGLTEENVFNTTSPHGKVKQLVMLPGRSYCFLECMSVCDAESIFEALHTKAGIGQNNAIVFLSYYSKLPATVTDAWKQKWPPGLFVLEEFITNEEEEAILNAIKLQESVSDELKHRKVTHFGYEFFYGRNSADLSKPLHRKIPEACDILWPKLKLEISKLGISMPWEVPDQLTVNEYSPGHGIPPHVDTHSCFYDPILSLSLESDIVMDFRRDPHRIPVVLPRRSLLIMSGESRYDWTHGITPRVLDIIPTPSGALTTKTRGKRSSLTFRRLRIGPCDCTFPQMCDSKNKMSPEMQKHLVDAAIRVEQRNVHDVYDNIAEHFDKTRNVPWPKVSEFLLSFPTGSVVLDIGCGNGKYLDANPNISIMGCDRSQALVDVCISKGYSALRCDCLTIPLRSQTMDGCISIAVIHHLATADRRLMAVHEMVRVLKVGGRGLIYVWAKDQNRNSTKSNYLRQNKAVNKNKTTEEAQRQQQAKQIKNFEAISPVPLPIHTNRTNFQQQDVLVPWRLHKSPHRQNAKKEDKCNNNSNGRGEENGRLEPIKVDNHKEVDICKDVDDRKEIIDWEDVDDRKDVDYRKAGGDRKDADVREDVDDCKNVIDWKDDRKDDLKDVDDSKNVHNRMDIDDRKNICDCKDFDDRKTADDRKDANDRLDVDDRKDVDERKKFYDRKDIDADNDEALKDVDSLNDGNDEGDKDKNSKSDDSSDSYTGIDIESDSESDESETDIFYRFYHVFSEGELEDMVYQVPGVEVIKSFYDQGNFCIIFERKVINLQNF